MSEHDAPEPGGSASPEGDPDRAAILRRRQRFIAAALTGLAGLGAGCPKPQPCLSIAQPEQPKPDPSARPTPQVCLRVAAPDPTPEASPADPDASPDSEPDQAEPPAPR